LYLRLTAQEQAEADNSREGRIYPPLVWRANYTFSVHSTYYIDREFLCNQKIQIFLDTDLSHEVPFEPISRGEHCFIFTTKKYKKIAFLLAFFPPLCVLYDQRRNTPQNAKLPRIALLSFRTYLIG
jgi:hypothetical protein